MDDFFLKVSIMLVPGLLAITGHELAHGYAAFRFGDDTAKNAGRLTLNPLKHIDFAGMLFLFLIGIGWAKPVPVDFSRLKKPRLHGVLVALAGPLTNLFLASAAALVLKGVFILSAVTKINFVTTPLLLMLAFAVYINLLLAIFNCIPLPPLDGGRIMAGILPQRLSFYYSKLESYGLLIVMVIFLFSPGFISKVVAPPLYALMNIFISSEVLGMLRSIEVFSRLRLFPF